MAPTTLAYLAVLVTLTLAGAGSTLARDCLGGGCPYGVPGGIRPIPQTVCRLHTITYPDGRIVTCQTCCDQGGNCYTTCH
jgi:hypothetical protein